MEGERKEERVGGRERAREQEREADRQAERIHKTIKTEKVTHSKWTSLHATIQHGIIKDKVKFSLCTFQMFGVKRFKSIPRRV